MLESGLHAVADDVAVFGWIAPADRRIKQSLRNFSSIEHAGSDQLAQRECRSVKDVVARADISAADIGKLVLQGCAGIGAVAVRAIARQPDCSDCTL